MLRFFVFSDTPVVPAHEPEPAQESDRPRSRTAVPGPESRALRAREDAHVAPGLQGYAVMAGIVVEEGRGSAVTDVDGNTFLDFIGGINVNALGHSHPTFVQAVQEQAAKVSVGSFTSTRARRAGRAAGGRRRRRPGVHRLQLYSGGAEAVESALRLAKCHTGKYEFVSFWGGFHGKTMGALSLMGSTFKDKLGPMVPGAHQVPYADCYRCPVGSAVPELRHRLRRDRRASRSRWRRAGAVAAVIVEPMQGTAGNVIPPKEFLPAVRVDRRRARRAAHRRRDDHRPRPHRAALGRRPHRRAPRHRDASARRSAAASRCRACSPPTRSRRPSRGAIPSGSSSSYGGNPLGAAAGAAALRDHRRGAAGRERARRRRGAC